jgi:hypothetical protein
LAISAVTSALWRYVAGHRDLLEAEVTDEEIRAMTIMGTPNMGFYVVVVALALATQVAAFGYLLIAVVGVFRQRGDRDRRTPARLTTAQAAAPGALKALPRLGVTRESRGLPKHPPVRSPCPREAGVSSA